MRLLTTMAAVLDRAEEITPAATCQCTAPLIPWQHRRGRKNLLPQVGSQDLTFTLLPELYHEIFNEPEGPQIMGAFADWIDARLP